jgi:hypothetical protein
MQHMASRVNIPASLVHQHMPELAAVPAGQTRPIALQLVLLPAAAEDATADTPAQEVLQFSAQSCAVRRTAKDTTFEYTLSGLPLKRSRPVREGWWLRGVLVTFSNSVTDICYVAGVLNLL